MRYKDIVEATKAFRGLTPALVKKIEQIRHDSRVDNGGGGACHLVSEWIEELYGWARVSGVYTSPDYREPEIVGHYWNLLPDGSILDSTADQLGQGHDIRVVKPSDPEYHRYRPEQDGLGDMSPDTVEHYYREFFPHLDRTKVHLNGDDYDWDQKLTKERGLHRGVTDKKQHAAYADLQMRQYNHKI